MKINPKQLEKAMAKLGMQTLPIDAKEVIIRTDEKEIVIREPQVTKVTMSGQETWQIIGQAEERAAGPSEDDIRLVSAQTGASHLQAKEVLIESGGDLASAILKLKKSK